MNLRGLRFFVVFLVVALPGGAVGAAPSPSPTPRPKLIRNFSRECSGDRFIPFRGGRALAIEGVPGEPNTWYFGAVAGGSLENAGWRRELDAAL